jgi:hypothetical protein
MAFPARYLSRHVLLYKQRACRDEVMTVLAKPSAGGARGWWAAGPTALLCAIMIVGCGGGGAASSPGTRSPAPAQSASPSSCSAWTGLDDLVNVTTWLRQLIGDEVIFGPGTAQAKRDAMAVAVYAESLGGLWEKLPRPYARDLRDSVLPVAASPDQKTPEQLNTAANDSQSLAAQISQLCF